MFEQRLIGKFQDTLMRCFAAFLFELLIQLFVLHMSCSNLIEATQLPESGDIFVPFRKMPNVAIE